jgi:hypothetical protein
MCNVTVRKVRESLFLQKSSKYYVFVCVCVHARTCAQARGRVHAVRACSLTYPTCNLYAPCCDVICGPSGSTMVFDTISYTARFSGKKVTKYKMCIFYFLYNFYLNYFSF